MNDTMSLFAPKKIHPHSRLSLMENEAAGSCETYRLKIVALLKQTGRPMTDREIMNTLHVEDFNNIRPEITRLKQANIITECGKTKCPITGKTVRLVRIGV